MRLLASYIVGGTKIVITYAAGGGHIGSRCGRECRRRMIASLVTTNHSVIGNIMIWRYSSLHSYSLK